MDSRHRSQTPAHSLILTACASAAALVAAACGDSPTSEDGGGLCDRLLVEDSIQAIVQQGEAGWFLNVEGREVFGQEAAWVAEDPWIGLSQDLGFADSLLAVGVVGLTLSQPADEDGVGCTAGILDATVSTSARSKGTSEQVDARSYRLASSEVPFVNFAYLERHAAVGVAKFNVNRVILLPDGTSTIEGPHDAWVAFRAFDP